ncbi:hypothetical protein FJT64_007612 [Amphibalanus amphitrite]|uniref:Uncharacterized protein n=1 Tax=Amphibalanus amphitrite TaxID=1232801 RepID=A0A6A4VT40_AMPAM|nr:hypothetical protein FJT64_007612 [Amphibalanus amphitrite]
MSIRVLGWHPRLVQMGPRRLVCGRGVQRWHLACSLLLLLLLTTLSSALKCIRCKNCAAKYEESQSVRCDPDKDTCQVRSGNGVGFMAAPAAWYDRSASWGNKW